MRSILRNSQNSPEFSHIDGLIPRYYSLQSLSIDFGRLTVIQFFLHPGTFHLRTICGRAENAVEHINKRALYLTIHNIEAPISYVGAAAKRSKLNKIHFTIARALF